MKRMLVLGAMAAAVASHPMSAHADGDAVVGQAAFKACKLCHQIGEGARNFVGPELNGVVGRKAGSVPGYNYSDANRFSGVIWDEATLRRYLRTPREVIPGTKMAFPGLTTDSDIDNVIAYISQFGPDGKRP